MRKKEAHILIVDDDENVLFAARMWLKKHFTNVTELHTPRKILTELSKGVDVVLLDMNFRKGYENGQDGLYWMEEINTHFPNVPVILMTAYGEVDLAVQALKKGAVDFILKPWDNDKLYASVNLAVDLSRKNNKLKQWENLQETPSAYLLQSYSQAMQELFKTTDKVSNTDASILLTGENGTGKTIIAEHIHKSSERRKQPFVHIDLGSLSENLFESELFGYSKGAFTDAKEDKAGKIENANGGTVFLDEIGNLPPHLQTKLLNVLQTKKISRVGDSVERKLDIRFISATNEDLKELIDKQNFRSDLYYRINTVELSIPPLREREEDIPNFIQFFKEKYQKKYNKSNLKITANQLDDLCKYSWPGNVRELDHTIERGVIMSENGQLKINLDIPEVTENKETLNLEEMEEVLIRKAMKKYKGNITEAAQALGLSRAALYRRLDKFKL